MHLLVAVAAKHGFEASFLPKFSSLAAGNGFHTHISLHKVRFFILSIERKSFRMEWMRARVRRQTLCQTKQNISSMEC